MSPREDLKTIYTAAINAVNPGNAVRANLKREKDSIFVRDQAGKIEKYDLTQYKHIYVVGAGKATSLMTKAVEEILGDRITSGIICVKYGYTTELKKIRMIEAAHPVPDAMGAQGAKEIHDLLDNADEDDLVISLISGGGSALLPLPPESITLDEKKTVTDLLLKSGAAIHEVNTVRKHISRTKGGNLARAAWPATVINMMISDVVGDNMDVIASGPFVPDSSTFHGAREILEKYNLIGKVPVTILGYIRKGEAGDIPENPGNESECFKNTKNSIIASNITALKAAMEQARELGYNACILSSLIEGDTGDAALWHARIACEIVATSNPLPSPACILSGGETTVVVSGQGKGGRNMEFALQAAPHIDGLNTVIMASIGTDGTDGPTDAAGALVDGTTVERASLKNMNIDDFIRNNDSYSFFSNLGDLIITGPTNTNVMDIRIILVS